MTIRRCTRLWLIVAVLACAPALACAQGTRADYERAAKFLPEQMERSPTTGRWIRSGSAKSAASGIARRVPFGKQFVLVDAAALTAAGVRPRAAGRGASAGAAKQPVTGRALPFDVIRFTDEAANVQFEWERRGLDVQPGLRTACTRSADRLTDGRWRPGRGAPPAIVCPRTEVPSPDGKLLAFVRDHNLWVRRAGDRRADSAEPRRRALLRLRAAAAVADADGRAGHRRRGPDAGDLLVTGLDADRDLRHGSAQLPAPDDHAVGAAGSVQARSISAMPIRCRLIRSADRQARVVRRRRAASRSRSGPGHSISCITVGRPRMVGRQHAGSRTAKSSAATSTSGCVSRRGHRRVAHHHGRERACRSSTRRFC